jgi:hypothetical protein
MFAYAMLGAATVMALYLLLRKNKRPAAMEMDMCDNLVQIGFSFMTLGLLSGRYGQKRLVDIIGAGIPKKPGRPLLGFVT